MPGPTIRGAKIGDIPSLADTLALAFDNDPAMRWVTREDERRFPALVDLFTYCLESDLRHGWITTTEDLNACAIWVPPQALSEKPPALYTLRMLPRYICWCGVSKISKWLKFTELCEEKRPKTPHHYLDFIGVHPDKQGQGYASSLLRYTLTYLDALDASAYLESSNPRNNPLYEHHGFQTTDEINLPNGPKLWCMNRKPTKNTTSNTC